MRLGRRYKLCNINSTEIYFDSIWFIPFAMLAIAVSYYSVHKLHMDFLSTDLIILGTITSFSYFMFSTIHELSHIIIARKYGLHMKRITLFLGRMDSHMSSTPQNWWEEFSTAIFGPIINLIFMLIFMHIKELIITLNISVSPEMFLFIKHLISINALIFAGNLLVPALPFDGGRIMRSVLWGISKNYIFATRFTILINYILGITLITVSILYSGYFYIVGFVGIFILAYARREQKKLHKDIKT